MYARSKYDTKLVKMSFDEVLDLAADAFICVHKNGDNILVCVQQHRTPTT